MPKLFSDRHIIVFLVTDQRDPAGGLDRGKRF